MIAVMLVTLCATAQAQQPLVLTRASIPATAASDTVIMAHPDGVAVPARGGDLAWDYSALARIGETELTYTADAHPAFPGAQFATTGLFDEIAMGRGYFYNEYHGATDTLYGGYGTFTPEQHYGIGDLTLNPADSMIFPEQVCKFRPPRAIMTFPFTDGSASERSYVREVIFRVTVGMYGIDNTIGSKRAIMTQIDSVVGWGTLRLPAPGGGASAPMRVLLVKRMITQVDSFYLSGVSDPGPILNAFQMEQGAVTRTGRYLFFRENAKIYALSIAFADHDFTLPAAIYYDQAAAAFTTAVERPPAALTASAAWPNPSRDGSFLVTAGSEARRFVVRDVLGRLVGRADVASLPLRYSLPAGSPPGVYFYHFEDESGAVRAAGRMVFAR
jgi:hypothetical protein